MHFVPFPDVPLDLSQGEIGFFDFSVYSVVVQINIYLDVSIPLVLNVFVLPSVKMLHLDEKEDFLSFTKFQ